MFQGAAVGGTDTLKPRRNPGGVAPTKSQNETGPLRGARKGKSKMTKLPEMSTSQRHIFTEKTNELLEIIRAFESTRASLPASISFDHSNKAINDDSERKYNRLTLKITRLIESAQKQNV